MVAAHAVAEPDTAPNAAHPMAVPMARPPLTRPTHLKPKSNRSLAVPVLAISKPIKIKSGTHVKTYCVIQVKGILARELMATSKPAKIAIPKKPTLMKPNAMGTPKATRTNNNKMPIKPINQKIRLINHPLQGCWMGRYIAKYVCHI